MSDDMKPDDDAPAPDLGEADGTETESDGDDAPAGPTAEPDPNLVTLLPFTVVPLKPGTLLLVEYVQPLVEVTRQLCRPTGAASDGVVLQNLTHGKDLTRGGNLVPN